MKKYNIFVHVISNAIIIALVFMLYVACVPSEKAAAVSAPIYKGESSSGKVALMINVYQGSEYVEKILKVMESRNAVATFFVGGCWAEKNMDLLKRMSERHDIGNHGYLHLDHAKLSKQQNKEEIALCDKLVNNVTGIKMNLFAPPSGSIGDNMIKVCEELNYKIIMWSKDTIDWRDKDFNLIYKRATSGVEGGDMILMHPTEHTLKALPKILDYYAENGITTVTVSEIIAGLKSDTF